MTPLHRGHNFLESVLALIFHIYKKGPQGKSSSGSSGCSGSTLGVQAPSREA